MSFNDNTLSSKGPSANLEYKDFDKYIILYGSLLNITENKNLNFPNFIIKLIESDDILKSLMLVTGVSTAPDLLLIVFNRFPHLCNSKNISNQLKKHGRRLRQIHI